MVPERPKIYHITHVDNLSQVVADEGLCSDAVMIARGGPTTGIGMARIKQRRLSLPVQTHRGTHVGDYVPFYFCPRSIMLYVIYTRNSDLAYRGGQDGIVHIECDLHAVVQHAEREGRRWAFTSSNAGANYADFFDDLGALDQLNWQAIQATQWSGAKGPKQAEFLLHGKLQWELVERIGVRSASVLTAVQRAMSGAAHQPRTAITTSWYY